MSEGSGVRDEGLSEGRYAERPPVDRSDLTAALEFVAARADGNLEEFGDEFLSASSENFRYRPTDVEGWTASFWTGSLWLLYHHTGNDRYRRTAAAHLEDFESYLRSSTSDHDHDLGFLYTLSAVAESRYTGSEHARQLALDAATKLADRYLSKPGVIQAWGDHRNPDADEWSAFARGRIIVDTMLNLPLLFWAAEQTDHERYRRIARSHACRTARHLVRRDASTFHTFVFDVETGEPLRGETFQGHADDSCWSRGQAWVVYGFALAYRYTGEDRFLDVSRACANYYLNRLPADHVPRWDFDAPADDETRDTSAAAIAACGLDELATHLPAGDPARQRYENACLATLASLGRNYTTEGLDSNGVLTDGTQFKPEGTFDECTVWGDYFYLEALIRALSDWEPHW